jgi:rhamnosyltransferase
MINTEPKQNAIPRCIVLLAAYNGRLWIKEQLESILCQKNVVVHVLVGDDKSSDDTKVVLKEFEGTSKVSFLRDHDNRLGSAGKNFQRLIREADIGDAQYVALSDQDDIWFSDKLIRAINVLETSKSDGYSSNVKAFWPSGKVEVIYKSNPQTKHDHFFSSPGPGCTFVFTRHFFFSLKNYFIKSRHKLSRFNSHDWLIYAYARQSLFRWVIDDFVSMKYRQHQSNEFGANRGFFSRWRRFKKCLKGEYFTDVLTLGHVLSVEEEFLDRLEMLRPMDRFWLAVRFRLFRRNFIESLVLLIFFIVSRRPGLRLEKAHEIKN